MNAETPSIPEWEEYVYLLARTPLQQFLDFVATETVDAQRADRRELTDTWRAANERVKELEQSEADWADRIEWQPVSGPAASLIESVHADPIFNKTFATVPVEVAMVPLDRLVVRQKAINLVHVQRTADSFGPHPSDESILRSCLPFDHPTLPARIGIGQDKNFVFVSKTNDLRILDTIVLRPHQITGYQASGPIAGVVGVVVGYGSNYVNAIHAEGRLVLNNGSHRTYALRKLGVTHVPCVIQKVSTRDELNVVAVGALRRDPDLYLKGPRPPVLKDYFDPKLRTLVRLAPTVRHVHVRCSTEAQDVPENA